MKSNILVFLMGFLHLSQADLTEKIMGIKTLANAFDSLSVLDYGSRCSPQAEDQRNKLVPEILPAIQSGNEFILDEFSSRMARFIQDNSARGLCNTNKLLTCDPDNAICDCGPKKANFNFTRESGICRWAIGSECVPTDFLGETTVDAKCARGSHCMTKFDLEDCSLQNVVAENILKNREIKDNSDICYCKRDSNNLGQQIQSTSSSSSEHHEIPISNNENELQSNDLDLDLDTSPSLFYLSKPSNSRSSRSSSSASTYSKNTSTHITIWIVTSSLLLLSI